MKYGRGKREAKRLEAEYHKARMRPFQGRAFCPPGWTQDDDAQPWMQAAIDNVAMGKGGAIWFAGETFILHSPLHLSGKTDIQLLEVGLENPKDE